MNKTKDCSQNTTIGPDRNNYFDGKVLTARDFRDEQAYLVGRRNLHNRLLHGYGVVCGFDVMRYPVSDGNEGLLLVTPGMAIDGCGREIILNEANSIAVTNIQAEALLLCVRYCEQPAEFVPTLGDPDAADAVQANRIREVADLVLRPLAEMDPRCWQASAMPCLPDEECPCAGLVPLAAIFFANPEQPQEAVHIDLSYRRRLLGGALQSTRIEWVNWPHGGELSLNQLRNQFGRQLLARFSDELQPARAGSGISNFTFQVQALDRNLAPAGALAGRARLLDDRRTAVFTLSNRLFDGQRDLDGLSVAVTLKCDFIVDRYGNAVDGNHLHGRLPSGNGSAGGDFYSWFRVAA